MAKKDSNKAQLDLLRDAQSIAKSMGASEENIAELQQEILEKRIKSYDALLTQLKVIQEITTNEKARAKTLASVEQIESSLSDIIGKMSKDKFKMAQMSKDELDLSKQILKEKEDELATLENLADIDKDRIDSLRSQINVTKQLVQQAEQLKSKFGEANLALINEGFDQLQNKIDDITSFLPKGISKFLGVDTLSDGLKEAAMSGKGLSKALIMTGAVAVLGLAYNMLADMNKQATEFAESTGLSVSQSQNLVTFKILTHGDEKNMDSELRGLAKIQPDRSFETTTRLKHLITSVEGKRDKKDIREFVDVYLTAQVAPGIDMTIDIEKDGYTKEGVSMPIGLNFFWPDSTL